MRGERQKLWLVYPADVMRELSLVEWSVFTGVVSAFVVMTVHLLAHV